jgi:nitrogenase molybdenum-iron protein alpha/beta subunit
MALFRNFPVPSKRLGMLWALAGIEDAVVIDYGPEGTLSYFYESLESLNAQRRCRMYTIAMSEKEAILGNSGRLSAALAGIARRHNPRFIFVSQSPVSEIIGDDLEAVCAEARNLTGAGVILLPQGGLKMDWTQGTAEMLEMLVKRAVDPARGETVPGAYNIIGSCLEDLNYAADAAHLMELLKKYFGMEPLCVLPSACSITQIEHMGRAQLNVVLKKEGLPAAEYLRDAFHTPYVYQKPYGIQNTLDWLEKIGRCLAKKPDPVIDADVSACRQVLDRLVSRMKGASAAIGADYDTVRGFRAFFEGELGVKTGVWCNSPLLGDGEIPFLNEDERLAAAAGRDYLFADLLTMRESGPVKGMQIANPGYQPSLQRTADPFCGFGGVAALLNAIELKEEKAE